MFTTLLAITAKYQYITNLVPNLRMSFIGVSMKKIALEIMSV